MTNAVTEDAEVNPTQASEEEVAEEKPEDASENQEQSQEEEATQPDADATLQSFLKEQGLTDESEETGDTTEEKTTFTRDEMEAELQRQLKAEGDRQKSESYKQGVRKAFEERPGRLRSTLQQYQVDSRLTEWVIQQFTEHHGQVQELASEDAMANLTNTYNDALFNAAEKKVKGVKDAKPGSADELMEAVVAGARKGYVSAKEAKTQAANAVLEFKKQLEDKKLLPTSKAVPADGETGSRGTDLNTVEGSLTAPIADIIAAQARRAAQE